MRNQSSPSHRLDFLASSLQVSYRILILSEVWGSRLGMTSASGSDFSIINGEMIVIDKRQKDMGPDGLLKIPLCLTLCELNRFPSLQNQLSA